MIPALRYVWAVHTTLPSEIRPTDAVFGTEEAACARACEMSTDAEVLAASVVRFAVDELGTRRGVAMFVDGQRQMVPYVSDCRGYLRERPPVTAGRPLGVHSE